MVGLTALGPLVVQHALVPALAKSPAFLDRLEAAAGLLPGRSGALKMKSKSLKSRGEDQY